MLTVMAGGLCQWFFGFHGARKYDMIAFERWGVVLGQNGCRVVKGLSVFGYNALILEKRWLLGWGQIRSRGPSMGGSFRDRLWSESSE